MWILVTLLACSSPDPGTEPTPGDTDTDTDLVDTAADTDTDTDVPTLNGTAPATPIAAPEFVATNYDGTTRGQGDLIGSPTVLWFYPKAATAG